MSNSNTEINKDVNTYGISSERYFFVLSVAHTSRSNPYITLWAPDDAGYRGRIETAGRYPESKVISQLGYYNNGCDTVAVPCDVAAPLSFPVRPGFFDNDEGRWLRNNRETWQALLKHTIRKPLHHPDPKFPGSRRSKENGYA